VNNAQIERRVSVARWDNGKLTVFASTQGVSNARTDIAKDFGYPSVKFASSASTWAAASATRIKRRIMIT